MNQKRLKEVLVIPSSHQYHTIEENGGMSSRKNQESPKVNLLN
jgi:hypothetical protein